MINRSESQLIAREQRNQVQKAGNPQPRKKPGREKAPRAEDPPRKAG